MAFDREAFMQRISDDEDFRQTFRDDPKTALDEYGHTVTDEEADAIKAANEQAEASEMVQLMAAPRV